eukprot:6479305-Amphidinium_carterae.1
MKPISCGAPTASVYGAACLGHWSHDIWCSTLPLPKLHTPILPVQPHYTPHSSTTPMSTKKEENAKPT